MTPEPEVLETTMTKRLRRYGKWWRASWQRDATLRTEGNLRVAQKALLARDWALLDRLADPDPDRLFPDVSPLVDICLRRSGRSKERGP